MTWETFDIGAVVAIIGLIITTVQFVGKAIKGRNWSALVSLVLKDMTNAEKMFDNGADRKQYCMDRLQDHATFVGYPLSDEDISRIFNLIDSIVEATKVIN